MQSKTMKCKFKRKEVHSEWHLTLIKTLSSKSITIKIWRWIAKGTQAEIIEAIIAAKARWERKVFKIK